MDKEFIFTLFYLSLLSKQMINGKNTNIRKNKTTFILSGVNFSYTFFYAKIVNYNMQARQIKAKGLVIHRFNS